MSKKKSVKYERLEQWVEEHDARLVQAGSYPAQVVYVLEDDLKSLCKHFGLPRMGKLSGGRCYQLAGEDFFAVIMAFKLTSGQLISAIAHECYHATNFIYKRYGVRHSLGNDEPGAYLISHMAYYAAKFIEEQGYALSYTGPITTDGEDSADLRGSLPDTAQGRVDGSAGPATGAGGTVQRSPAEEGVRTLLSCGCFGRCSGHPEPPATCPICGEVIDPSENRGRGHVCALPAEPEPSGPDAATCPRCGIDYFLTQRHVCKKIDVLAWEKRHEQDA